MLDPLFHKSLLSQLPIADLGILYKLQCHHLLLTIIVQYYVYDKYLDCLNKIELKLDISWVTTGRERLIRTQLIRSST